MIRQSRLLSWSAVVATAAAVAVLPACGGSDTKTLDSTSTTAKSSVSSVPSDETYEGLVETLTKTGMTREQARCVVDKLNNASTELGDPDSPGEKTRIEKLLEACKLAG